MKKWKCSVCGYVHTGDSPPDKCPVCGADKSVFTLMEESPSDPAATTPSPASGSTATEDAAATRWRCTVCGYIHQGDTPPDKCPVCGADRSLFVPIQASASSESDSAAKETAPPSQAERPHAGAAETVADRLQRLIKEKPYADIVQRLTQLHGHPIAVHIPNGLLPVSVLFTLLALIFGSEGLATAARYNICIVALAMPIVIATGLVDWINRFGGHMTRVFKMKMACAGAVTALSIIVAFWWFLSPNLFYNGILSNLIFLILNLANLAAAGLAGWYGGKLVFQK